MLGSRLGASDGRDRSAKEGRRTGCTCLAYSLGHVGLKSHLCIEERGC